LVTVVRRWRRIVRVEDRPEMLTEVVGAVLVIRDPIRR
jgi:hypothetical protein